MVTLREVDRKNYLEVIKLAVSEEQKEYIASNVFSLAQAKVQPECVPLAIYSDNDLVGFVMYCMDVDDNEYWIYRVMIDTRHQNRGYGRAALLNVIDIIQADKKYNKIYLSFEPENTVAKKLYEKLGFIPDGRIIHGEIVYCLNNAI